MDSAGSFGGGVSERDSACGATEEETQRSPARESWPTVDQLVGLPNPELARVDPVVMNLVVARGVPALAGLEINRYVSLVDRWAADIKAFIPIGDLNFYRTPELWQNNLDFSRLAIVWWYLDKVVRIAYREDQREICRSRQKSPSGPRKGIRYTDPTDLFLNGVMDTNRGTCGNMAMLYMAICWRLGWPVGLACVGSHFIARYDDGKKTFNIEASMLGDAAGFVSPLDDWYRTYQEIPQIAVDCGSDLRVVTPRELLGLFVGLRARHFENTNRFGDAEPDYLLARYLFPNNRNLYICQNQTSVQCSMELFEPHEKGHPVELLSWLQDVVRVAPWNQKYVDTFVITTLKPKEKSDGPRVDAAVQQIVIR